LVPISNSHSTPPYEKKKKPQARKSLPVASFGDTSPIKRRFYPSSGRKGFNLPGFVLMGLAFMGPLDHRFFQGKHAYDLQIFHNPFHLLDFFENDVLLF
jgi:hypothetical protein